MIYIKYEVPVVIEKKTRMHVATKKKMSLCIIAATDSYFGLVGPHRHGIGKTEGKVFHKKKSLELSSGFICNGLHSLQAFLFYTYCS